MDLIKIMNDVFFSFPNRYKHRNVLSLIAISDDGPRPCLVYEYMENGSLADCLLGKVNELYIYYNTMVLQLYFYHWLFVLVYIEECSFGLEATFGDSQSGC